MGTAAAASLTRRAWAQGASREAKLARIGMMFGGFGGRLRPTWDRSQPVEPQQIDAIMDAPQLLADTYGLHNMDIQSIYFLSMEPLLLCPFQRTAEEGEMQGHEHAPRTR